MKKISSGDEQKLEFEFPMEEDDSLWESCGGQGNIDWIRMIIVKI